MTIIAMTERGIPEWGSDIIYTRVGAIAWDNADGKVYISKVTNPNRATRPSNNPTQWAVSTIQYSLDEFMAMETKFDDHIARMDNPHGVDAEMAGTYTAEVIDNKINAVQVAIDDHVSDMDNPHNDTAAGIGAVPITGGSYTGAVGFLSGEVLINPGAGDHAIYADAAAVGLRYGNVRLGLDKNTGRAFISTPSETSLLLDEDEYVEARAEIEPAYAVPTPDYEIDPLSDIHPRRGVGFTDFFRPVSQVYTDKAGILRTAAIDEPCHEIPGLVMYRKTGDRLDFNTIDNCNISAPFTFSVEFLIENLGNEDAVIVDFLPSASVTRVGLFVRGGMVSFRYGLDDTVLPIVYAPIDMGETVVITCQHDGTSIRLLKNGVQSGAAVPAPIGPNRENAGRFGEAAVPAYNHKWWLRKFRFWNRVLTKEQMSTL